MNDKGSWFYAIILLFVAWSVYAFRADISQISLDVFWVGWRSVLLAAALSLVNYLLRIWRWFLYLRKLGHTLPPIFTSLTYVAGFAFTLSPGKVGEMIRGRYLQKAGVPLANTAAAFFTERLMDLLAIIRVLTLAPWQRIADWVALPDKMDLIGKAYSAR